MTMTTPSTVANAQATASHTKSPAREQLLAQFVQRQHEETLEHFERQSKERQDFLNSLGIALSPITNSHSTTPIDTTDPQRPEVSAPQAKPISVKLPIADSSPAKGLSEATNARLNPTTALSRAAASVKSFKTNHTRRRMKIDPDVENSPKSASVAQSGAANINRTGEKVIQNDTIQPVAVSPDDNSLADSKTETATISSLATDVVKETQKSEQAAQDEKNNIEAANSEQDFRTPTIENSMSCALASQKLEASCANPSAFTTTKKKKQQDQADWNLYQQVKAEINLEYLSNAAAAVQEIKNRLERSESVSLYHIHSPTIKQAKLTIRNS